MENRYSEELLDLSAKLDAVADGKGEFTKCALSIVERQDPSSTSILISRLSRIKNDETLNQNTKKLANALKNSLLLYYGYYKVKDICAQPSSPEEDPRSLEELLAELNQLVGLLNVKARVNDLIAFQRVQMLREQSGLKSQKETLHLAFTGNPGTGKTTVARIVGHIYKKIGLLSRGHFIEVSRTDLIAGYQGQTALKVKNVIEKAKGGVLFIDEAYSITENDHSDSYGRECLTELTKALEDYRDDLVVIVAGYTGPMKHFFDSNPGLRSRFNSFIEFDDYTLDELVEMFVRLCDKSDYSVSPDAQEIVRTYIEGRIGAQSENFSNGRLVRNMFDWIILNHARRVSTVPGPSRELLSAILPTDCEFTGFQPDI